jgi:hypothetical protein
MQFNNFFKFLFWENSFFLIYSNLKAIGNSFFLMIDTTLLTCSHGGVSFSGARFILGGEITTLFEVEETAFFLV